MPTNTDITCHLVFATKNRERVLNKENREDRFRFIWGVLKNRSCHLYRIGGVEDHLHILFSVHPTQALSNIVKEIKTASSAWIKGQKIFPHFTFWQEGYGAFTVAAEDRPALISYIQNQEQHHATISFTDELQQIVEKLQLTWHADHLP